MNNELEKNQGLTRKNIENAINLIYIATVFASIGINLFDIVRFIDMPEIMILLSNIPAIMIVFVSYLLKITGIISLKKSFSIIAITILANSIIGITQSSHLEDLIISLLRETVFLSFLISISAFIVSKRLAYFISITFSAYTVLLYLNTNDAYVIENMPLIILTILSYTYFINYLNKILKKSIYNISNYNETLSDQIDEIHLKNKELSELTEKLNTQSRELEIQNESLNNKNFNLTISQKELKALNKTKDKLFSVITHDIKNPLHVILGYSQLLTEKYKKIDENKKWNYTQSIHKNIRKLYSLLENLLTWSNAQQNKININPTSVDLNRVIAETVERHNDKIKHKKINIIFSTETNLIAYVDKNMTEQALGILIDNAIKFSYPNGIIKISGNINKDRIILKVTDNGIGIPEKLQHTIFELNQDSIRPGTLDEKGSGFGLAICKLFIEKHNGVIDFSSKNDETTFYIQLPSDNKDNKSN